MNSIKINTNLFKKPPFVFVVITFIISLYLYGSINHLYKINYDKVKTDQSAYMDYAKKMYLTNYKYIGGRNRMPVYPFIQSLFYRTNYTDEEYFIVGKFVNIVLSLVILLSLYFIFKQHFPNTYALLVLSITAFNLFIFKAAYFQCELLFYFLNFISFLLMLFMFLRPSMLKGISLGIILGIAHLTKASVIPGFLLFLLFYTLENSITLFNVIFKKIKNIKISSVLYNRFVPLFFALAFFFLLIFPYIQTSKKVFGKYFYNVNSTFYMWYDSWEEVKKGTRAYGDRVGWPKMNQEQIPSPKKYLAEHTFIDISYRFTRGIALTLKNSLLSYGYFKYVFIILLCVGILLIKNINGLVYIIKSNLLLIIFITTYFMSYFLLYAWYAPIASGNRFVLALYLPLVFVLSRILFTKRFKSPLLSLCKEKITLKNCLIIILTIILIIDIPLMVFCKISTLYGGD